MVRDNTVGDPTHTEVGVACIVSMGSCKEPKPKRTLMRKKWRSPNELMAAQGELTIERILHVRMGPRSN